MPQKSTEHQGVGQSGYAAGRRDDPALEKDMQIRPQVGEGDEDDLDTDDRFHGRGGPLTPKTDAEEVDEASSVLQPPDESEPE